MNEFVGQVLVERVVRDAQVQGLSERPQCYLAAFNRVEKSKFSYIVGI